MVKFYDARLLTLPLRASKRVYFHCTSPETVLDYLNTIDTFKTATGLDDLKNFIANLNCADKEFIVLNNDTNLEIEDYSNYKSVPINNGVKDLIKKYIGIDSENLAVFKNEIFSDICKDSLPVIARNKIGEDGKSENLFYEEVLPRRSKLWFMLGFDENITINSQFGTKLTSDLIQMGANASIGYGVTQIRPVGGA